MKALWDEFDYHMVALNITKLKELYQLIQFLMSFHEGYDNVKKQILQMEPKPIVSKAYSILLGIEAGINNQNTLPMYLEHSTARHARLSSSGNKDHWKPKKSLE